MKCCTFFGHRQCQQRIEPMLLQTVEELIREHGVTLFYVGGQGEFDRTVQRVLNRMQERYPKIEWYEVLAYHPERKSGEHKTLFPEAAELGPVRFALSRRNRWMVQQADFLICYAAHDWGGAARFVEYALRQRKCVINLAEK